MDQGIQKQIQHELLAGESILWTGRPQKFFIANGHTQYIFVLGLFIVPFSAQWVYETIKLNAHASFIIIAIALLLFSFSFTFGHIYYEVLKRKKRFYFISNKRVMVVDNFPLYKFMSLDLKGLPNITLENSMSNLGDIFFGPRNFGSEFMKFAYFPFSQNGSPAFESIEDAKHVYETILAAQEKLKV